MHSGERHTRVHRFGTSAPPVRPCARACQRRTGWNVSVDAVTFIVIIDEIDCQVVGDKEIRSDNFASAGEWNGDLDFGLPLNISYSFSASSTAKVLSHSDALELSLIGASCMSFAHQACSLRQNVFMCEQLYQSSTRRLSMDVLLFPSTIATCVALSKPPRVKQATNARCMTRSYSHVRSAVLCVAGATCLYHRHACTCTSSTASLGGTDEILQLSWGMNSVRFSRQGNCCITSPSLPANDRRMCMYLGLGSARLRILQVACQMQLMRCTLTRPTPWEALGAERENIIGSKIATIILSCIHSRSIRT